MADNTEALKHIDREDISKDYEAARACKMQLEALLDQMVASDTDALVKTTGDISKGKKLGDLVDDAWSIMVKVTGELRRIEVQTE